MAIIRLRLEEQAVHTKDGKDDATVKADGLLRYPRREHPSTDHRQTRAHGVAQTPADGDAEGILGSGQRDGGDLRPIAPLGQEREGEGLDECCLEGGGFVRRRPGEAAARGSLGRPPPTGLRPTDTISSAVLHIDVTAPIPIALLVLILLVLGMQQLLLDLLQLIGNFILHTPGIEDELDAKVEEEDAADDMRVAPGEDGGQDEAHHGAV